MTLRPMSLKLTRRQTLTAMASGLALPYLQRARAASGVVNVYNWSDYIGETTLADFTAETGVEVVYDLYASSEEAEAKMLAGSTGYDLVIQSGMKLQRMIAAGVYQKPDRSKLPNWKNLDPAILKIVEGFDPGNAYGSPYMWGSTGITYNLDMVRERLGDIDLNSLDVIMKPENVAKLADCGISLLDSPTDWGYMVLRYIGLDSNTAGEAEYRKMAEAMAPIRQYVSTFDNANYLTTLPNKELCVANTWSGDYGVAKTRAKEAGIDLNLAYFVPKTGAPAWFDLWCMPVDAPNVENAHLFLDYMMRPEVIAACSNFTGYANANLAATPFVDPAIAGDPAVYPDAETLSRLYTPAPQTDAQEEALTRIWTDIKTGG